MSWGWQSRSAECVKWLTTSGSNVPMMLFWNRTLTLKCACSQLENSKFTSTQVQKRFSHVILKFFTLAVSGYCRGHVLLQCCMSSSKVFNKKIILDFNPHPNRSEQLCFLHSFSRLRGASWGGSGVCSVCLLDVCLRRCFRTCPARRRPQGKVQEQLEV